MLDKNSFSAFKTKLIGSLKNYSHLSYIDTIVTKLEAVDFKPHNPKKSYKQLHDILAASPNMNILHQPSVILSKFSSIITLPIEVLASRALSQAKLQAQAQHTIAMITQDCNQHHIPLNLAPVVNFKNLNTGDSINVVTSPKI